MSRLRSHAFTIEAVCGPVGVTCRLGEMPRQSAAARDRLSKCFKSYPIWEWPRDEYTWQTIGGWQIF
jgi:hypothetical protein